MRRRVFLRNSGKVLGLYVALPRSLTAATGTIGLKDAAAPCGRRVGLWLDRWMVESAQLLPMILENFNHATMGGLKWDFIRKAPDAFDFRSTDWLVEFCSQHGMTMHGHNLCWNGAYPRWLPGMLTPANAQQMLTSHISTVMKRYQGKITSYDVVNEPIATWLGRPDGLYTGPWLTALGPEYIDVAFHAAFDADPSALRVLNTAHVEQNGKGDDLARSKTLDLVRGLVKRGVPIQAVGLESHLYANAASGPDKDRDAFVAALRDLGLKILITELDVNDTQIGGGVAARDQAVAACYSDYLRSMLPEANPPWVSFFCYTDLKNWYELLSGPQYTRVDGTPHRPGLLDAWFSPKPSYDSVRAVLRDTCR
jgi:endo-1,4-beta-xylanase